MYQICRFFTLFLVALLTILNPVWGDEVVLEAGQTFHLRISGVPADEVALVSQKFSISDAGTIQLPYLKDGLRAIGMTPSELARKIEAAYRAAEIYTAPTIQVDPEVGKSQRFVSVIGEVRAAGTIQHVAGITLIDAIAQTGGFTDFAKTRRIKLTRDGKFTFHDLSRGDVDENVKLLPNDIVTVP